jgi:hypothetical protein
MQESNVQKKQQPDSDATSKETLKDLEKSEEISEQEGSSQSNSPSPDGALDEEREVKDAGPI